MKKYISTALTFVLLFVVTSAFSQFKKKHLLGVWKIDIETTKKVDPVGFKKNMEDKLEFVKNLSYEYKEDGIMVLAGIEHGKKGSQDMGYTFDGNTIELTLRKGKKKSFEILTLNKKTLVSKHKNVTVHFYKKKESKQAKRKSSFKKKNLLENGKRG